MTLYTVTNRDSDAGDLLEFDQNAKKITALHQEIRDLFERDIELKNEISKHRRAAQFMEQLIEDINSNPLLQEEWELFLKNSYLLHPSFKIGYETSWPLDQ